MSPVWGHLAGVTTLVLMFLFLAIWVWAWLPRHKRSFDELAKLPMEDVAEDGP
ncbi:MAG: cbb3-type cytochrome c oxidase subunit 3 [Burkholderiales bacterium]|nr:cbb3-type cytochrome c oxidase subunit 3 [Burkholderiales bacterium]